MNRYRLINSFDMLNEAHKINITSDINHALIEYGFIVKANFLKWLVFNEDTKANKISDIILDIVSLQISGETVTGKMVETLREIINKYLYDLPARRRTALAFILFNSTDFHETIKEFTDYSGFSAAEKKKLIGREVEREIYVNGSYNMEQKIGDYLTIEVINFTDEFKYSLGKFSRNSVLEIIDIYCKTAIAKFSCEIVE